MKTTSLSQMFVHRSRWIAALVFGLICLFAPVRPALAQTFTQANSPYPLNICDYGGFPCLQFFTNVYYFYDYNGNPPSSDGTDPDASGPLGGAPLPVPISYFYPFPAGNLDGQIPPALPVMVTGSAVPGCYANFTLGNNPTGVGGLTLYLPNPNPNPDEVRLDWVAVYTYVGPTLTSFSPLTANITAILNASSYYALAGGETIYDGDLTNYTTATFYNNFPTVGLGLGAGPWYGYNTVLAGTYTTSPNAAFVNSPTGFTINSGDTVEVQGYLDLVVDPGTVQVQIEAAQPPAIVSIGAYSNQPVVLFPTATGTGFAVQTSTNLNGPNWVTVTNGIQFSGLLITNPPSPAFFRLQ